ncbi:MaoC family dehydratase [Achromobacter sp. GG226]|uniref:MaoC family dehydratase n=1 Tax=Verticiella alkaliphila TaxID=2779529 RepID=UPI001C0CDD7D|nr:MaoC family dehydratase [Verticiella sp. GG226]MBU4611503.1 MaoC family dehydratase [Verticiella sp. GG226]
MQDAQAMLDKAKLWPKGNGLDDMQVGQVFEHHWGRTLTDADNIAFTTNTLHFNPLYFNAEYARAHGHPGMVLNPMLVFLTVFGMSVEDLSESGGAFLGVEDLTFHEPVYPGDTLTSRSTVLELRPSNSRTDAGIATWHTEGFNAAGARVIDFKRTNMISRKVQGK